MELNGYLLDQIVLHEMCIPICISYSVIYKLIRNMFCLLPLHFRNQVKLIGFRKKRVKLRAKSLVMKTGVTKQFFIA